MIKKKRLAVSGRGLTALWTGRTSGPVLVCERFVVPRVLERFAFTVLNLFLCAAIDTLSEPLTFSITPATEAMIIYIRATSQPAFLHALIGRELR